MIKMEKMIFYFKNKQIQQATCSPILRQGDQVDLGIVRIWTLFLDVDLADE